MGQAWELFVDLWETGNRWARQAILLVLVTPLVALAFALFGFRALATATALTALLAPVFMLLALIDPMVVIVVAVALGLEPTATAVRRWLARWISLYIGSVLAYGVYLFFVPIGNNPVLVLPLIAAVGAMALFAISGARGTVVRWTTYILAVIAVAITLAFFFGGKAAVTKAEARVETPAVPAPSMESVREITRIPLLGEGIPSEQTLVLPGSIPPLWYYYFEGPPSAQVHFDDGTVGPITKWFGQKGGTLKFSGQKGEEVVVRAYPPPPK